MNPLLVSGHHQKNKDEISKKHQRIIAQQFYGPNQFLDDPKFPPAEEPFKNKDEFKKTREIY